MSKFKVEINTGNMAFCDPFTGEESTYFAGAEVARILKRIVSDIENSDGCIIGGTIMDINGNRVGKWEFTSDNSQKM